MLTLCFDPRLEDVLSEWDSERHGPIGMPSRLDMDPKYKRYFIFPEEFYAKYSDGEDYDPDENQDWYKQKGMWVRGWHSVESLERAASFKEFLYNSPEKEIIVITGYTFFDLLTDNLYGYKQHEWSSCIWKPTVSGRMRLVPPTSLELQKDILEDKECSEYWPYRLCGRSELFNKWYAKPWIQIFEIFVGFEERKKFLGLEKLTFESLEAELGPELVQGVKNRVQGDRVLHYYRL